MKRKDTTLWTIAELYEWACREGVENVPVYVCDDCALRNIDERDINISHNEIVL